MKWNGNKARQTKGPPDGSVRAEIPQERCPRGTGERERRRKQTGRTGGTGQKQRAGDMQSKRGNGSSMGNYQSGRDASKRGNKSKQSLQNSKSRQSGGGQISRPKSIQAEFRRLRRLWRRRLERHAAEQSRWQQLQVLGPAPTEPRRRRRWRWSSQMNVTMNEIRRLPVMIPTQAAKWTRIRGCGACISIDQRQSSC